MTGELLLLLPGAVLILASAVAGRIKVRAIALAQVGRTLRIAAAGVGVMCVVAALILIGSDSSSARAGPLGVTITDELGPDQVSEQLRVFLDGEDVGVVRVDEQSPKARLTVTVAKVGRHDYRTETTSQIEGQAPKKASNTGDVVIDGESHLEVRSDEEGRTYLKPR
jgi:hypothetical protein